MRRMLIVPLLLAAACQSTKKEIPEGTVQVRPSPEYDKVRPVTIALLPVKAPRADIRIAVRQEAYTLLPERRYSPFKLEEVDKHVDSQGRFDAENLDWDATLEIVVDKWVPVYGDYWAASGHASMTHRTGEVIWACDFDNYSFLVPSNHGVTDQEEGGKKLAYFLLGGESGKSRLPDCPPPPGP